MSVTTGPATTGPPSDLNQNNVIDYSSLYLTPDQLPTGVDPVLAYTNALVSGVSPAYINSPNLPGNRYFLDTKTSCVDSASNVHTRSVLVDNVLTSKVNTLGKTSSGVNTGLMYSLLSSINNIGSSSSPLFSGSSHSSLPVPSAPASSSGSAASYLNTPNLPLCVPVSVYIDGTDIPTVSGWVTHADMSNIDPRAISYGSSTEGFTALGGTLATLPAQSTIQTSDDLRKSVTDMRANAVSIQNETTQQMIDSLRTQYLSTYIKIAYPFLNTNDICTPPPPSTDGTTPTPSSTTKEMINTFINYVSKTNPNKTISIQSIVYVLQSALANISATTRPFIQGLIQSTKEGGDPRQNLIAYITAQTGASAYKPPVEPYLIEAISETISIPDNPTYEPDGPVFPVPPPPPSSVPGNSTNIIPPQYIASADYVQYQNQYIQYQNKYAWYQAKFLLYQSAHPPKHTFYGLVEPVNPYDNNPYATNPFAKNPNTKYVVNPAYCSFIADLEVLRKSMIDAMLALDYPKMFDDPSQPPKEGFHVQTVDQMNVGQMNMVMEEYDALDWMSVFYYGSLTLIGLYIVYRLFCRQRR